MRGVFLLVGGSYSHPPVRHNPAQAGGRRGSAVRSSGAGAGAGSWRGLGSYCPSYEEMLRFYSYYKQATVGSCAIPRPGFWDPIGRYKWDAWNSLGKMSKEEAMAAYISEMKRIAQKIIDTIPMDKTSEHMFGYFEPLYDVIHDMPRPPESFFKRKAEEEKDSEPTKDGQEERLSGNHVEEPPSGEQKQEEQTLGGGLDCADEALENSQLTSDSESEVFCDTLEQMEADQAGQLLAKQSPSLSSPCSIQADGFASSTLEMTEEGELAEGRRQNGRSSGSPMGLGTKRELQIATAELGSGDSLDTDVGAQRSTGVRLELDVQVAGAIHALQDNMQSVMKRLSHLETVTATQMNASGQGPDKPLAAFTGQKPSQWPLEISARTLLFLIAWPFIVQWLLRRFQRRKR
ncbi:acyl-CoA-binding domain-containing protein 4 isoform X2 [Alligator mississippiensis]|uniref:acyl-CoA-binding domain-containing protein 4 isoform X2 n=1 Tax=Alligator mississippiensis TaxID=8496 RepID=UPI002877ECD1|nr:acyl-CoA-binding domain-containing protein 4 isoform X2 [Alligator mississippiensis]